MGGKRGGSSGNVRSPAAGFAAGRPSGTQVPPPALGFYPLTPTCSKQRLSIKWLMLSAARTAARPAAPAARLTLSSLAAHRTAAASAQRHLVGARTFAMSSARKSDASNGSADSSASPMRVFMSSATRRKAAEDGGCGSPLTELFSLP